MTAEASPSPWQVDEYDSSIVRDAGGRFVARADAADAALIVNAVNIYDHQFDRYMQALRAERDRLRDIVRRLVSSLSVHHSATMAAVMSNREKFDTPDFRKDVDADAALLRDARAAIGEDTSP